MIAISQNMFRIIIGIIVVVGLIIIFLLLRNGKDTKTSTKFFKKQAEIKQLELIDIDMKSRIQYKRYPIEQYTNLANIKENTSDITKKTLYTNNRINAKANSLEIKTEDKMLEKVLKDIEKKEQKFEGNINKKKSKLSKYE